MEYYLGSLVEEIRRRGGLPKPLNSSGSTYNSTSDNQIATYVNEATQQTASRIVQVTAGWVSTRNAGWFYRSLPLTIDSTGYVRLPLDVGKLIGFRDTAEARQYLVREGVGDYRSAHYRIEPMRAFFRNRDGSTVYIDYNSNMAYSLIQATATATGAATVTTNNASMLYGGELVTSDDYYNGLDIKIVAGTGLNQVRRVTDYDAATGTFTVDSAWTTPLSTDSVFATLLPLPVEAREFLFYETLLRLPMAAESDRYMQAHERAFKTLKSALFAKDAYQ